MERGGVVLVRAGRYAQAAGADRGGYLLFVFVLLLFGRNFGCRLIIMTVDCLTVQNLEWHFEQSDSFTSSEVRCRAPVSLSFRAIKDSATQKNKTISRVHSKIVFLGCQLA